MFLYSENLKWKNRIPKYTHLNERQVRKVSISPQDKSFFQSIRAFLFAPLRGSLTVEAAVVLPLFLFFMIAVMQYGRVMETAVKLGTALSETGKKMAMSAYISRYGGDTGEVTELIAGVLSAVYAQHEVLEGAGDTSSVKNANMALSSFLQEDEMIDLVLTYQVKSPVSIISLPGNFFIQKAQVRAWTGRVPPEEGSNGEEESSSEMVYVTATGSVYHEDADCTHLKLSVHTISVAELATQRNNSGGIYHACEKCGGGSGSIVYITKEGNRYHSSLECSGLKRTVRQISKEEAGTMRACTKCGTG